MDGLLRSHIQFQGDVASYVFAGSEPGLMRAALRGEGPAAVRPGGADASRAPRDEDIAEYVAARFARASARWARR